jgi:hypothetical protein
MAAQHRAAGCSRLQQSKLPHTAAQHSREQQFKAQLLLHSRMQAGCMQARQSQALAVQQQQKLGLCNSPVLCTTVHGLKAAVAAGACAAWFYTAFRH